MLALFQCLTIIHNITVIGMLTLFQCLTIIHNITVLDMLVLVIFRHRLSDKFS